MTSRLFGPMYPRAQFEWRKRTGHPEWRFLQTFTQRYGTVVRHGPFGGMTYPRTMVGVTSSLVPKLLGAYECELHDAIEDAVGGGYDTVVNIGAAEGYYAVGLATRLPDAVVYAFEADSRLRARCRELAGENGVLERLVIRGACSAGDVQDLASRQPLVICDCEGCEFDILGSQGGDLRTSMLIVELHEFIDARTGAELIGRLTPTHDVETVESRDREPAAYPELRESSPGEQRLALTENRPVLTRWAICRPCPT